MALVSGFRCLFGGTIAGRIGCLPLACSRGLCTKLFVGGVQDSKLRVCWCAPECGYSDAGACAAGGGQKNTGNPFPLYKIPKSIAKPVTIISGGLSFDTNEKVLKDAFSPYGQVLEVRIVLNRDTGRSKGFGFVQFASENEADNALKEMDGQYLDGRSIRVDFATSRPRIEGAPPRAVGPPPGLNRETTIEGLEDLRRI
eukprot:Gb_01461 [translate_table: standard]